MRDSGRFDFTRRSLLEIFQAALVAVNGRRLVGEFISTHPLEMPVYVIALGKVACAMTRGAIDGCGAGIRAAFVVTKQGHAEPLPWPVIEAAHPVPDETCLAAGGALCCLLSRLPGAARV